MATHDLTQRMEAAGARWMAFGPAVAERDGAEPTQHEVAEDFDQFEAEYAAIRRTVGVMHWPWRRVLPVTGKDAGAFLHALLTQDVMGMDGGQSRRSLMLDAKGMVLADLWVHRGDDAGEGSTWLECDAFDAGPLRAALDAKLFAEDVTLGHAWEASDALPACTCFALLGPASVALLEAVRDEQDRADVSAEHPALNTPGVHQVVSLRADGQAVKATVTRRDDAGVVGLRLWVPSDRAAAVYGSLLDAAGFTSEDPTENPEAFAARRREGLRGRPVGWSAYNTARIEAGTPLFHVDFGPTNLPAEAGVVDEAVSFTKGCFPGQEAVARMKNLGHPKKVLAGLKLEGDAIPVAGSEVFDAQDAGRVVGAVTSSAVSPLRGSKGVAIAMLRWGRHEPGTKVKVAADGGMVEAEVTALGDA